MAEKYLHVTMPDHTIWSVPAALVAADRAKFYAERVSGRKSGPDFDRVYTEEFTYTLNDPDELIDWAKGNMNWCEVVGSAKQVGREAIEVDYEDGWVNGPMRVVGECEEAEERG